MLSNNKKIEALSVRIQVLENAFATSMTDVLSAAVVDTKNIDVAMCYAERIMSIYSESDYEEHTKKYYNAYKIALIKATEHMLEVGNCEKVKEICDIISTNTKMMNCLSYDHEWFQKFFFGINYYVLAEKQTDPTYKDIISNAGYREALGLFTEASNLGSKIAKNLLGHMYLGGKGTLTDLDLAVKNFFAANNDPVAKTMLGRILLNQDALSLIKPETIALVCGEKTAKECGQNHIIDAFLEGNFGAQNYVLSHIFHCE